MGDGAQNKKEKMRSVRDAVWNLTQSPLYTYRKENNYYPVIGEGSHNAKIMFIGEAPGKNEALEGRPFCGAAGKILDEMLSSIGADRSDVYITNIVKDRPPNNRDPKDDEIALYSPFLIEQINIIQPEVIATLGRFSMEFILKTFKLPESRETISRLHGKKIETKSQYGKVAVIPFYHPAVALYNNSTKGTLLKDFEILKAYL